MVVTEDISRPPGLLLVLGDAARTTGSVAAGGVVSAQWVSGMGENAAYK